MRHTHNKLYNEQNMIVLFLIIIEKIGLNMKLYKFTASTKKNREIFINSPVFTSFFPTL